ncbi:MAG TPA: FAD-binding protein [Xanthobacteraceae bacterium]|nr:FAD-binding protein [Xanthobacteraceae bacterium]
MSDIWKARDTHDVEAAIGKALAEGTALEIVGHGSKRDLGRPAQSDATLDLSALKGVTLYEPAELVLSARAGTPLAEIETLIAPHGQELAFEPMDYGPLLGTAPGRGTIGGVLAINASGPRRIKAGAARDHFLGFTAVSGRGETFKSGGRVVKNVTGYDLSKLLAGSWGTLAAMTDVTLKVLPRAETEQTVVVEGLDEAAAVRALTAAMAAPCDVSGAAHVPGALTAGLAPDVPAGRAATVLRLEGVAPSIAQRRSVLEDVLRPFGPLGILEGPKSRALWRAIRDVVPLAAAGPLGEHHVWRISTAPTRGAELARLIGQKAEIETLYDWAGGLLWLAARPDQGDVAAIVRGAVRACGGHARLIRAPAAVRAAADGFDPQDEVLAALTRRVKAAFDPCGVLGAGRMWAGI